MAGAARTYTAAMSDAPLLIQRLKDRHLTLATAESLTGGLLGAGLTAVPGASAVYVGGFVTYTDAMKTACLGVPAELLRLHGAVSGPVAAAMATGALEKTGADWAVSTTGVAGPDGGTAQTPVGTVWFGLARKNDSVETWRQVFVGDREAVRRQAVTRAIEMLATK